MRIDLNGIWKATAELGAQSKAGKPDYPDHGWANVVVPGHWQDAPDLRDHAGRVLYRRTFEWEGTLPAPQSARLVFEGVFYEAKVWLNGAFTGEHSGYFVPAQYDVTRHLRPGTNVLVVEVTMPEERDRHDKRTVSGLFAHWEGKPAGFQPGGIWRDVSLQVYHGVVPEALRVRAAPFGPGDTAAVSFAMEVAAQAEGQLDWTATFRPETFDGEPLSLSGGQPVRRGWNQFQSALTIPEPRLWWTWDQGRPDLYRFSLEMRLNGGEPCRLERLIGLRSIEVKGSQFHLNGRPIFIRGAAYAPPDIRLARAGAEQFRTDLSLMRSAHLNLARVLAHVSKPALYEEASRQGILLWQDFPLQGLYSRSVLPEARRQATALADLLGHWPAVALWCGHADPFRAVDPGDPDPVDRSLNFLARLTGSWNMSALAPAVRESLKGADPSRPAIAHPQELGEAVQLGWQTGRVEELDRRLRLFKGSFKFVTGFGAQSFPVPEHSARFVRGAWPNLNWSHLAQQHMLQPKLMERHVPHTLAQTLEQYIAATQWYQSYHSKYVVEQFRRRKYQPCGGILYDLFADCVPGVTPALVDYWRQPKPAYRTLQEAFRPVTLMADWPQAGYAPGSRIALRVYLVNDTYEALEGTWTWVIERDGKALAAATRPVRLGPDQLVTVPAGVGWTVPYGLPPGAADLVLTLNRPGAEPAVNRYAFNLLPSEERGS